MTTDTNQRIVCAAIELFASRGYSAISTKDIAKAAAVNEATLFRQFGDKRSIMEAAIAHKIATAMPPERIRAALAIRDFEDAMRTFARCVMSLFSTEYIRLTNAFAMEMPREAIDAFTRKHFKPAHDALAARIKAEQRARRVHATVQPYAIGRALICVLYGHAAAVAFWGDEWKRVTHVRPEHVENYVTVWLRGILLDSKHLPPCK